MTTLSTAPLRLANYRKKIEEALSQFTFSEQIPDLYDPMRYLLTLKAKRMRPTLVLIGLDVFHQPAEKGIKAACGIELFHNFTLMHDDIMDKAPTRRGMATVHEKWNQNVAILSGDAMFVLAHQCMAETPTVRLKEIMSMFQRTAIEVCEGQMLDMQFEQREEVLLEEYVNMIRLKTAVLLGCSLYIGAMLAEAESEDALILYAFGVKMGIAFQLQDDYLDAYGDSDKFGKQVGGDILSNKKTWLLLKAKALANPTQKALLSQLLQEKDGQYKVKAVLELYEQLNIKNLAEQEIQRLYQEALQSLQNLPSTTEKELLYAFAEYLMSRES